MPADSRIVIPKVEFYITNVCNLSCHNCNRYNNYDFKGWQSWNDYKDIFTEWAKKIQIGHIVILGGEPLLNPTINEWVTGLHGLLSTSIQIVTNGTHLNKVPGLYDLVRQSKAWIQVSIHNVNDIERHFQNIREFFPEPVEFFQDKNQLDKFGRSITKGSDYLFQGKQGFWVAASVQDSFYNISIYHNEHNQLTLHNNNPEDAHRDCGFVKYKNYHFIHGKLYKCGPVALLPEFDQQYPLAISDEDRTLLNSYHPLSVDEFDQRGAEFIKHIDDVIPQCKFCPTNFNNQQIFSLNKTAGSTGSFKS